MLKQAFRQSEELQEEVVPLFNLFSNRLDDLVDSSDEEDIISRRLGRNVTSPQLPATRGNRVSGNSELDESMEGSNRDTVDVSFLH